MRRSRVSTLVTIPALLVTAVAFSATTAGAREPAWALEIFEDLPDTDVIFTPVGGGSGASGCCIARTGLGKKTRVIGVQAAEADAFARSWRGPERVSAEHIGTFAEGLATRYSFDLTFGILKRELDDIVTLTEAELEEGVRLALRATHNLAEGAGDVAQRRERRELGET